MRRVLGKICLILLFFAVVLAVFPKKDENLIVKQCLVDYRWYNFKDHSYYTKGQMSNNPKHIVIHHSISDGMSHLKKVFEDNMVSCHYFIDNNGKLINVINDKCVAYHAGVSYWNGDESLNNSSICIEILNDSPFTHDISNKQYKTLINLLKKLKIKYGIENKNIVLHSDIAYFKKDFVKGYLNRKQDISYLFQWKKLANNNVGIWYNEKKVNKNDYTILYYFGDEKEGIIDVKNKLKKIGYKIDNINDRYDVEFYMQSIVFHRRFFPEQLIVAGQGLWTKSSTNVLNVVVSEFDTE